MSPLEAWHRMLTCITVVRQVLECELTAIVRFVRSDMNAASTMTKALDLE